MFKSSSLRVFGIALTAVALITMTGVVDDKSSVTSQYLGLGIMAILGILILILPTLMKRHKTF